VNALKESLPIDMRFAATFISAQILASAVSAETLPEKVVAILMDVCVAPTSSEARMATGEKTAAAENWKLLWSGPTPIPVMNNENGPKQSFESVWQFGLPEGSQVSLSISILRPEQPGVKYDVCLLQPAKDVDSDDLTRAIDSQFGSMLLKDTSGRFRDPVRWYFVEEKARGNCGKQVWFSLNESHDQGKPKILVFTDFAYPDDEKWDGLREATARCPN
jgi:hypothetical protein